MFKNLILVTALIITTLPILANEINMTPQGTFSGYYNKSTISSSIPKRPISQYKYDDSRYNVMRAKSVHEMGDITPSNSTKAPMSYNQFPNTYDSSNSMMMMQGVQNSIQNSLMGY